MLLISTQGELLFLPSGEVSFSGGSSLSVKAVNAHPIDDCVVNGNELTPIGQDALERAGLLERFFTTQDAASYLPMRSMVDDVAQISLYSGSAPSRSALIVCVGSNPFHRLVAQAGWDVEGIDIEQVVIERLDSAYRPSDYSPGSATFVVADAANYARRDAFDLIVCSLNGLRYLGGHARILRHLMLMCYSMRAGARYFVYLEFGTRPSKDRWAADDGSEVVWEVEERDLLHEREVVESIRLEKVAEGVETRDRHVQSVIGSREFIDLVSAAGLGVDGVFSDQWIPCGLEDGGNLWVVLTKGVK